MTDLTHADGMTSTRRLAEWRKAAAKELAALGVSMEAPLSDDGPSQALKLAEAAACAVAKAAWPEPLDQDSLRLRAEVVQHRLWPSYHGHEEEPMCRFSAVLDGNARSTGVTLDAFDERAVAELVRAVLHLTEGSELAVPARPAHNDAVRGLRKKLQEDIERIGRGLCAARTLINACQDPYGCVDQECVTALGFVLDGLDDLMDVVTETLEGAEVRPSKPTT